MFDSIDGHDMDAIVDIVKNTVHPHSQAIVCRSLQSLGIRRTRVFLEPVNVLSDQPGVLPG